MMCGLLGGRLHDVCYWEEGCMMCGLLGGRLDYVWVIGSLLDDLWVIGR